MKNMTHKSKRIIALLMALTLMIGLVPQFTLNKAYAADEGTDSYSAPRAEKVLGGTDMTVAQSLKDNGDGTFTLTLGIQGNNYKETNSTDKKVAQTDYFVAEADGNYLVELWGGNGGNGEKKNTAGGIGGAGGYVYGIVEMKAGDILFYTIGGNGVQTKKADEASANEGTGHGNVGSVIVGGGGGFSAVYSFTKASGDAAKFLKTYTDLGDGEYNPEARPNLIQKTVLEQDRLTKYIMIAGGGGGGGAGQQWTIIPKCTGRPDGGTGGTMDKYAIDDDDNTNLEGGATNSIIMADGTVYVGKNGKSATADTKYVGRGATNDPGREVRDFGLGVIHGDQPNDWTGTASQKVGPGGGGNGDMRGGGGGAGYAGGSGGLMAGLLEAWDVGGGGGGSSYVSNKVITDLPENAEKLLRVTNTSSAGGSAHITRLDNETSTSVIKNPNYLNDMTLALPEISKYFNAPTAADITVSGTTGGTVNKSVDGHKITLSGFNMGANDGRKAAQPLTVSIKLTPSVVGGNGVNLFKDSSAKFTMTGYQPDDTTHAAPKSMTVAMDDGCSYVNVPFELADFEVFDQAHNSEDSCADAENNNHVQALNGAVYNDDSAAFAAKLGTDSDYDFITAFDGYTVKAYKADGTGTTCSDPDSLNDTKSYDVTLSAVVSTAKIAKVGEKVGDASGKVSITKHAIVSVLKAGEVDLNDDIVRYKKTLTEDGNGVYTLSLNIKSTVKHPQWEEDRTPDMTPSTPISSNTLNSASDTTGTVHPAQKWNYSNSTYTVPADGYYFVQAWGGNGGNGGDSNGKAGGTGAAGGYASGIFKLTKDDVLHITVGNAGSNGDNQSGLTEFAHGGSGGSYSAVQLNSGNYLAIAGGGGGGSGAGGLTGIAAKKGGDAKAAAAAVPGTVTSIDSNSSTLGTYNGDGQWRMIAGIGNDKTQTNAESGASIYDTSAQAASVLKTTDGNSRYTTALTTNPEVYMGKGKVVVTPLELDKVYVKVLTVKPYDEFSVDISKYFDIQSVTVTGAASYDTPTTTDNHVSVKNIKSVEANKDNGNGAGKYDNTASKEITPITIAIKLTAKEGFLGGNNVPVIKEGTFMALDQKNYTEKDKDGVLVDTDPNDTHAVISAQNATDFANVKIPEAALADYLTTYDRTITAGDSVKGTGSGKDMYLYEVASGMPNYYTGTALDWQDDFVTITKFDGDLLKTATDKPAETKTYKYSYGIQPTATGKDVKATVIGEVSGQTYDKAAVVTVMPKYYNVAYVNNTAEVIATGENRAQAGKDFTYTVYAGGFDAAKYKAVVSVTVDGTKVSEQDLTTTGYSSLTIAAAKVTGDITVTTNLVEKDPRYKVNINVIDPVVDADEGTFVLKDGNLQGDAKDKSPSGDYADQTAFTVDQLFTMSGLSKEGIQAVLAKNPGYHFEWQCDDASDEGIFATVDKDGHVETIGDLKIDGGDLWIYGVYVQDHYGVTVNYYKIDTTTTVADSTVIEKANGFAVGQDFTVPVPSVSGWAADIASVSGKMPSVEVTDADGATVFGANTTYSFSEASGLTVNVFYKELAGALKIYYVKADTNEPFAATHEQTITAGSSVNVTSPAAPTGYNASKAAVTIASVTAEQVASGVTEYVYYIPNDVTVTFNANGGSDCDPITVQYGSVYGAQSKWDGSTYTTVYEDLPTPVRSGYEFEGWYTDVSDADTKVTSDMTVTASSGTITLTAKWTARTYNLTVRYVYGENYEDQDVGSTVYSEEVIPLENATTHDPYVTGDVFNVVGKDNVLEHYKDTVDTKTLNGVAVAATHSHTDKKLKLTGTMPAEQDMRNQIIYVRYTPEKYTLTVKFNASTGAKTLVGSANVSKFPTKDMKLEYYYGQKYNFDVTKTTGDFYDKAVDANPATVTGKTVTDNIAALLASYKASGLTVSGNEIKGNTLTENTSVTVKFVAMEDGYVAVKITPHYDDQGYTINHSNDKINFTIKADDANVDVRSEGTDTASTVTSVTGTNAITVFVKPNGAAKLKLVTSGVTAASPDGYASTDFTKGADSECATSVENIALNANAKFVPPVVTATVKHEINGLYANKTDKLQVKVTLTLPTGAPLSNGATMKVGDGAASALTFSDKTITITKSVADAENIVFAKLPKNTVIKVDNTAPDNYVRTVEAESAVTGITMASNTNATVKDKDNRVAPNLTGIADLMRGNLWLILIPVAGICAVVVLTSAKRRDGYQPKRANRK